MGVAEGAEAGDILVLDWDALDAELVDGGRQVAGVPQRDGVDDQAERGELVLLALAKGWRIWPPPPWQIFRASRWRDSCTVSLMP